MDYRYISRLIVLAVSAILFLSTARSAGACEMCTIPRLGKDDGHLITSQDKRWFFKYLFEYQNWHEKEAGEAHGLHHQGHHFHDKTHEEIHHLMLGGKVNEQLTLMAEVPYIVRNLIEIDDHSILGSSQQSEGFGDLLMLGQYKLLGQEDNALSAVAGIKFPTGVNSQENSIGTKFEPELQPGSRAFDYVLGGIYQREDGRWTSTANLAYVLKTEGEQDFELGDLLSTSLLVDFLINPDHDNWRTRIGIDANLQYEQKQKESGEKIADSGGVTLLMGPTFNIAANNRVSIFGSVMLPLYQDLGGVHQDLDWTSVGGIKINW